MNVEGNNLQIEFLDQLARQCICKADSQPVATHEPEWLVSYDKGSTWIGPIEWNSILSDDGTTWLTKMHATSEGVKTLMWLENHHPSDRRPTDGPIDILDWSRIKWQITFDLQTNNSEVIFHLIRK